MDPKEDKPNEEILGIAGKKRSIVEKIVRRKKNVIWHIMRGIRADERSHGRRNGGQDWAMQKAYENDL